MPCVGCVRACVHILSILPLRKNLLGSKRKANNHFCLQDTSSTICICILKVNKFAYIKTILSATTSYLLHRFCVSILERYDLVALSKIHVWHKVVNTIRPCCTDATIRSYYSCCRINEPVIFSHCVNLKQGHRFHTLLSLL